MRQQIEQYLKRHRHSNHPEKDGFKCRFFSFSFNRINVEQFINLKYFKDLIFISGLFFVLNTLPHLNLSVNINCNPNQILWVNFLQVNSYANEE